MGSPRPLAGAGATITVHRHQPGTTDAHGNPTTTYSTETLQVYGIAPTSATEQASLGRDWATTSTWEIYAPPGTQISAYDRVTLPDGTETQVLGEPRIWEQTAFISALAVNGVHFVVQAKKG